MERLDWHLRDTSGDEFVFVDDNARITELANAYRSGDTSVTDELIRRLWYRYACAMKVHEWVDNWPEKYEYSGWTNGGMTDYDRYYNYLDYGNIQYNFAYGYIDTYEEYRGYFEKYFVNAESHFSEGWIQDLGGDVFRNMTGAGFNTEMNDPTFTVRVEADRIILTERREVWTDIFKQGEFTGEYHDEEIIFEYHDGMWKYTVDWYGYVDAIYYYKEFYGSADPFPG